MTHDDFVVGDESKAWKRVSKGVIASPWLERESDRVTDLLHPLFTSHSQCAGKGSKRHIWRSSPNICENLRVCSGPAGGGPYFLAPQPLPARLCIPQMCPRAFAHAQ